MFGQSIDDLQQDLPDQIPPPIQQILTYLRTTDSFAEQPTLFYPESLNKTFDPATRTAAKNGLAQTAFEFAKQQAEPDFLTDYIYTTDELEDEDENDICSLYAQILGEYLTSLPTPLVLTPLGQKLSKEAILEVHAAEEKGGLADSASIATNLYALVRKEGREARVDALFYILHFLSEHVMAAALYGDVTPMDVAESIHTWIFQVPTEGSKQFKEEMEEGCTLALSIMMENAGIIPAKQIKTPRRTRSKSPSLKLLNRNNDEQSMSFVQQRVASIDGNFAPPEDSSLSAPLYPPPPPTNPDENNNDNNDNNDNDNEEKVWNVEDEEPDELALPDRRGTIEILEQALKVASAKQESQDELGIDELEQSMAAAEQKRKLKVEQEKQKKQKKQKEQQEQKEQEALIEKKARQEKLAKFAKEAQDMRDKNEQQKLQKEQEHRELLEAIKKREKIHRKEKEKEKEKEKKRIEKVRVEKEQAEKEKKEKERSANETMRKEAEDARVAALEERKRRQEEEKEEILQQSMASAAKEYDELMEPLVEPMKEKKMTNNTTTLMHARDVSYFDMNSLVAAHAPHLSPPASSPPASSPLPSSSPASSSSSFPSSSSASLPNEFTSPPTTSSSSSYPSLPLDQRNEEVKNIEEEILQSMMRTVREEAKKKDELAEKDAKKEENEYKQSTQLNNINDAYRGLRTAMSTLRTFIEEARTSTSDLRVAYTKTTDEARRLARSYREDRSQNVRMRQTLMSESQKLVNGLENSDGDRALQLTLMNR